MKEISVLGIPFDFGQEHSGVRFAAEFMLEAGLVSQLRKLAEIKNLGEMTMSPKALDKGEGIIKWAVQASHYNKMISDDISGMDLADSFLLNIGGDHGMALGTIHGILKHRPDTVVVWADAHGDINSPETSPSGNFHGMPLTFLMNLARDKDFNWIEHHLDPSRLILIGPRDLDQGEKDFIRRFSIQYFSSEELNRIGAKEVLEQALHRADPYETAPIHLSFDVDIFDHRDIPSTGTRVEDGPRLEEVFLLGGLLGETGRLKSMDVVEFNPLIGSLEDVKQSYHLIEDFILSTMSQVIQHSSRHNVPLEFLRQVLDVNFLSKEVI